MKRASGVLMHITSLPGEYGIGTLGREAREFARLLKDCGFSCWQILPVTEPDEYNSPYKSASAFAGNPWLIDLEALVRKGLLHPDELAQARQSSPYLCEFGTLASAKLTLLKTAFSRTDGATQAKTEAFAQRNPWVLEYARFKALKIANHGAPWQEWTLHTPDEADVAFYCFLQYEFFSQWEALKRDVNEIGIEIIGDMPIYVALDSADTYANRDRGIFQLDEKGHAAFEAGVPPDYFAKDGQGWGNPLYNWDALKAQGYAWWIERVRHSLTMFDKVRLDHFRGMSSYWAIPAGKKPIEGEWKQGPGMDFFDALQEAIPAPGIIAEDLGDIDQDVVDLVEASGFPGMRVFQFAFDGDPGNPHLPYQYVNNCVAYTGTHDNNTLLGWLWELEPALRGQALRFCGFEAPDWQHGGAGNPALRAVIRTILQSGAGLVMLPVQDLCGFGADTRMNTPGISANNWAYRITWEQLGRIDKAWCLEMNQLFGRA